MIQKTIHKSYKFKVSPTIEQVALFEQWFGCRRFVYNKCANIQIDKLENKQKMLSNFDLDKMITQWKANEASFLSDTNSQALQQTTKDVKRNVKKFFDDIKKGIIRKKVFNFKKKYDSIQSISFPNYKNNSKFLNDKKVFKKAKKVYFQLPKCKTPLEVLKHRNWEGSIKNLTLSKSGDCYYLSIQTEQAITIEDNKNISTIGIDAGVKKFVVTSQGEVFKPLNSFRKHEKQLAKLQRKLARCIKKSKNFYRLKKRINKCHKIIAQVRKDYLHKISHYLVNNHATIYVEDLKINNMSKSAKGDEENHGKNVKQKSGLNKSILDQGWSMFFNFIEYKQSWKNNHFNKVKPQFTSQECCLCKSKHKENRISQSKYVCNKCDNKINADLNASFNIEYRGYIKDGLSKDEAQEIINKKFHKTLTYANPWAKEGKVLVKRKLKESLQVVDNTLSKTKLYGLQEAV